MWKCQRCLQPTLRIPEGKKQKTMVEASISPIHSHRDLSQIYICGNYLLKCSLQEPPKKTIDFRRVLNFDNTFIIQWEKTSTILRLENNGQAKPGVLVQRLGLYLTRDCQQRLWYDLMLEKSTQFPMIIQLGFN